jgi:hypothetical protein
MRRNWTKYCLESGNPTRGISLHRNDWISICEQKKAQSVNDFVLGEKLTPFCFNQRRLQSRNNDTLCTLHADLSLDFEGVNHIKSLSFSLFLADA